MRNNSRAVIAYIAYRLISGQVPCVIYDCARNRSINIDGTVNIDEVKVYDYEEEYLVDGVEYLGLYELHHHGFGHRIELKINGYAFEGYDYGKYSAFSGEVMNDSVSVYDEEHEVIYEYAL